MIIENYIPTANEVRIVRNAALAETDYIPLMHLEKGTSVPQEWLNYRQALRDIPSQEGFPTDPDERVPSNLTWPTKPEV